MAKPTLSDGAAKMGGVVREVRERQRSLSALEEGEASLNPAENWARKYSSAGFGVDAINSTAPTIATPVGKPSPHHQTQFMNELKVKANKTAKNARSTGRLAMQKPFAPGSSSKRSLWSRMTRGS